MSDGAPNISGRAIGPVVDAALAQINKAVDGAIAIADATQNAAFATGEQVLAKVDSEVDGLVEEIKVAKERLSGLLQTYADEIVKVLP